MDAAVVAFREPVVVAVGNIIAFKDTLAGIVGIMTSLLPCPVVLD